MTSQQPVTWRQRAACAAIADDTFFPVSPKRAEAEPALAICASCPVITDCLSYACDNGHDYGIWGGTTADERVNLPQFTRRPVWAREEWQVEHGSYSGVRRHRNLGEQRCEECTAFELAKKREYERARATRIRNRFAEATS